MDFDDILLISTSVVPVSIALFTIYHDKSIDAKLDTEQTTSEKYKLLFCYLGSLVSVAAGISILVAITLISRGMPVIQIVFGGIASLFICLLGYLIKTRNLPIEAFKQLREGRALAPEPS